MRAWSQAYRHDGLLVVGVHTPEFGDSAKAHKDLHPVAPAVGLGDLLEFGACT